MHDGDDARNGVPEDEPERDAEEEKRLARIRRRAVALDGQPVLVTAVRKLRSRFPGDAAFGDPLSTAGEELPDRVARQVSALQPARPSAARELGLGALQVWQALSEKSGRGRGDEQLVLLFTDLVGFSSWALTVGDDAAVELLRAVGVATEGAIASGGGRIVKRLGDGVMAAFTDVEPAVRAALEAQQALAEIDVAGHRPRMRAGIHAGRPRRIGGDLLGVDVNIAARVGEAAGADEVLVSATACEQLPDDGFALGRTKRLKADGVPKGLQVRAVALA
jgi:class 3 adenylate cyclase